MEMGEGKYFPGWKCPPCCTELCPAEARRLELFRWPRSARRGGGGANSRPSIPGLRFHDRSPRQERGCGTALQRAKIRPLPGKGKSAGRRSGEGRGSPQHEANRIPPRGLPFSWHRRCGFIICKAKEEEKIKRVRKPSAWTDWINRGQKYPRARSGDLILETPPMGSPTQKKVPPPRLWKLTPRTHRATFYVSPLFIACLSFVERSNWFLRITWRQPDLKQIYRTL